MLIVVVIVIALWLGTVSTLVAVNADRPANLAIIFYMLSFFLLRNLWFAGWEMTQAAATPGKRLLKIRVAMRNGGRLTADAIFARNVAREIELFLPMSVILGGQAMVGGSAIGAFVYLALLGWTLIFLLLPLFNRDQLRVGDLLGGTWVVMAPRERLKVDLASGAVSGPAERFAFSREQLNAYGVMELQVLENVLRRLDNKIVRDVAARIRQKIAWEPGPAETDIDFLKAYYTALRGHLEQQLLFGRRRKDKHDRP